MLGSDYKCVGIPSGPKLKAMLKAHSLWYSVQETNKVVLISF